MRKKASWLFILFISTLSARVLAQDSDFRFSDPIPENRWVAPPPPDATDRSTVYDLQALYQNDVDHPNSEDSILDLSVKRPLDENAVLADGEARFEKNLSDSDEVGDVQLRIARLSYLQPWIQITAGRFDLFETLTSNLFFGGYPVMGLHRADGILVTIPVSFFFQFGPSQPGRPERSSPLALSFFYTPSLFSAQQVRLDGSQDFLLGQIRLRIDGPDFESILRVNVGESPNNFFYYSSLNGGLTGSVAADLRFNQNYVLTGEYGVQNISQVGSTSVFTAGLQANRLGTWGDFSLDQIVLEAQFPLGSSPNNPFTGGNGFYPESAQIPQDSFYLKVKARLKILFLEFYLTNNQDDYTLDRLSASTTTVPFAGNFGPGREADGAGLGFRGFSYQNPGFLLRTGVEF